MATKVKQRPEILLILRGALRASDVIKQDICEGCGAPKLLISACSACLCQAIDIVTTDEYMEHLALYNAWAAAGFPDEESLIQ